MAEQTTRRTDATPMDVLVVTMQTRWTDAKGREWRIVEKMPFGRNVCTTTDRRFQAEWTHKEIRAALAAVRGGAK
jgi:hypothetical protein